MNVRTSKEMIERCAHGPGKAVGSIFLCQVPPLPDEDFALFKPDRMVLLCPACMARVNALTAELMEALS